MDYKTLFTILVSVLLIQAIALQLTWRQNREEIGIRDWAYGGGCMALGSLLSAIGLYGEELHPMLNHLLRSVGAAFGAAGWFLVWIGTRHFYRRPALTYFTVVAAMALLMVVMAMKADASWRVSLVSLSIVLFSALTLKEFLQRDLLHRPTVWLMLTMLLFTSGIWLLRAVTHLTGDSATLIDSISLYNGTVASLTLTVSMILLTNERINQRLHDQATRDPLTGVMNRRAFFDSSVPMMAALHREKTELAVCLLDIDHFKKVNDHHGHAIGDQVLKQIARIAHEVMREGDLFARFGGEEFVVLLHNSNRAQAEQVMQRLREAIASQAMEAGETRLSITFSAGIAHAKGPARIALDTLLEAADRAMYQAKQAGRDRIMTHHESLGMAPGEVLSLATAER